MKIFTVLAVSAALVGAVALSSCSRTPEDIRKEMAQVQGEGIEYLGKAMQGDKDAVSKLEELDKKYGELQEELAKAEDKDK